MVVDPTEGGFQAGGEVIKRKIVNFKERPSTLPSQKGHQEEGEGEDKEEVGNGHKR